MSLTERTHVSAEIVRVELAKLEASHKQRSKTLKALLRALEAELPSDGVPAATATPEAEPTVPNAEAAGGKTRSKGAKVDG